MWRMSSKERISRGELFMEAAKLYARRSSCPRASVGVVAVREGRIVGAGYNGAPAGIAHCLAVGCDVRGGSCVRAVHAESNLIAYAAKTGTSLDGTHIYTTHSPCHNCAKLLLNAGVLAITYKNEYHEGTSYLRSLYVSGKFDESTGQTTVEVNP